MTTKLTNKQTTYNATKIDEALGIKLDGQATVNGDKLYSWSGGAYEGDNYIGSFYYSNNERINVNIDTSVGIDDIYALLMQGASEINEELNIETNE